MPLSMTLTTLRLKAPALGRTHSQYDDEGWNTYSLSYWKHAHMQDHATFQDRARAHASIQQKVKCIFIAGTRWKRSRTICRCRPSSAGTAAIFTLTRSSSDIEMSTSELEHDQHRWKSKALKVICAGRQGEGFRCAEQASVQERLVVRGKVQTRKCGA